jgi:hypothetical protein
MHACRIAVISYPVHLMPIAPASELTSYRKFPYFGMAVVAGRSKYSPHPRSTTPREGIQIVNPMSSIMSRKQLVFNF